jgi:D-alanyl-D-alanine carboxypeptidase
LNSHIKRFTALLLAVIIIAFSFSGCALSDKIYYMLFPDEVTEPTTESTTEPTTEPTTETTTEVTTTEPVTIPTTEPVAESAVATTKKDIQEYDEEKKLWAKQDVNVRERPTTESKKLGTLHEGNGVVATGKTSDGWYKVVFEEGEAYIYYSYLTDKEPARTVFASAEIVDPDTDLWYLMIVNKSKQIPADYVPKLVEVASSGKYLDYRVAPYYNDMYAAAKKDGIILTPFSGYRSYARQQRNFNNLIETYISRDKLSRAEATEKAATVILPPGTSEHNLGLAMDVCNTNSTFANQKEYKWLTEHAHEYGFILRYTAEKQDITGIIPEPWHWRFVGVEYAESIKNSGLCLEEYLGIE